MPKTREQIADEYRIKMEGWIGSYVKGHPEYRHLFHTFLSESTIKMMKRIDCFNLENQEFGEHFSRGLRITVLRTIADVLRCEYVRRPKLLAANCVSLSYPVDNSSPERTPATYDQPYAEQSPEQCILDACLNEKDAAIVQCRIDGMKNKEIGEKLGISRSQVGRRLRSIAARYDRAAQ